MINEYLYSFYISIRYIATAIQHCIYCWPQHFFQIVMLKYAKIYLSSNLTKNVGMNIKIEISYFGDNKCILAHLEFYLNHMQIRTNLCKFYKNVTHISKLLKAKPCHHNQIHTSNNKLLPSWKTTFEHCR